MRRGSKIEPDIQAAFCRVITIDEDDGWIEMSERESVRPGIIPDLIDRLAVYNHIMFPSIVVRRTAFEQLGGFHPDLFHAADWDMWKRIAARFPVWYEPEPLALYRIHTRSDTSRLMRTGANIADATFQLACDDGTSKEIAATVAFLASEGAGYITGQNIRVDGGLSRHV